jgi:alpha-L-fucosidase
VDFTPYDKDVLKELSKACKKRGIKLCFYHSIMDWHHPDASGESFAKYRDEYMIPQLEELLSGDYGDIGVIWFDGEWISEWTEEQGKELYQHLRSIKPDLIINNRVGKGRQGMQGMNKDQEAAGDFGTPEQEILEGTSDLDWESCMTMNDTWGFKKNDHNWKSSKILIHNLIDVVAKGGNYLLNVGPTAEGEIPGPSVERLKDMGEWIRNHEKAVYKTKRFKHFKEGESIRYASNLKGEEVFVYILEWPEEDLKLSYIKPVEGSSIKLLGSDSELNWSYSDEAELSIELPEEWQNESVRPGQYAWVLELQAEANEVTEAPLIKVRDKINPPTVVINQPLSVEINSNLQEAKVYYSLDGSTPDELSILYSGPLSVEEGCILKAVTFKEGWVKSPTSQVEFVFTDRFKSIELENPPSDKYSADHELSLYDGLRGGNNLTQSWLGFEGTDMVATIDLGSIELINEIRGGFLQQISSWIFLPWKVEFLISSKGKDFESVGEVFNITESDDKASTTIDINLDDINKKARFIKIRVFNIGECPEWHQGAGGKAWIFCDEIMIN